MFSSLNTHIHRASHYRGGADQMWYWWNLLLRRFPRARLPFRNRIVRLRHKPTGWNLQIRLGTTDWYVVNEILEEGEYEFVRQWNPESFRTIVDLGANIGLSTKLLADMSPAAIIKVVEPAARNLDVLRLNLTANAVSHRVFIIHSFAACSPGFAALDLSCGEWGIQDDACWQRRICSSTLSSGYSATGTSVRKCRSNKMRRRRSGERNLFIVCSMDSED